jgi:hypothetical protein
LKDYSHDNWKNFKGDKTEAAGRLLGVILYSIYSNNNKDTEVEISEKILNSDISDELIRLVNDELIKLSDELIKLESNIRESCYLIERLKLDESGRPKSVLDEKTKNEIKKITNRVGILENRARALNRLRIPTNFIRNFGIKRTMKSVNYADKVEAAKKYIDYLKSNSDSVAINDEQARGKRCFEYLKKNSYPNFLNLIREQGGIKDYSPNEDVFDNPEDNISYQTLSRMERCGLDLEQPLLTSNEIKSEAKEYIDKFIRGVAPSNTSKGYFAVCLLNKYGYGDLVKSYIKGSSEDEEKIAKQLTPDGFLSVQNDIKKRADLIEQHTLSEQQEYIYLNKRYGLKKKNIGLRYVVGLDHESSIMKRHYGLSQGLKRLLDYLASNDTSVVNNDVAMGSVRPNVFFDYNYETGNYIVDRGIYGFFWNYIFYKINAAGYGLKEASQLKESTSEILSPEFFEKATANFTNEEKNRLLNSCLYHCIISECLNDYNRISGKHVDFAKYVISSLYENGFIDNESVSDFHKVLDDKKYFDREELAQSFIKQCGLNFMSVEGKGFDFKEDFLKIRLSKYAKKNILANIIRDDGCNFLNGDIASSLFIKEFINYIKNNLESEKDVIASAIDICRNKIEEFKEDMTHEQKLDFIMKRLDKVKTVCDCCDTLYSTCLIRDENNNLKLIYDDNIKEVKGLINEETVDTALLKKVVESFMKSQSEYLEYLGMSVDEYKKEVLLSVLKEITNCAICDEIPLKSNYAVNIYRIFKSVDNKLLGECLNEVAMEAECDFHKEVNSLEQDSEERIKFLKELPITKYRFLAEMTENGDIEYYKVSLSDAEKQIIGKGIKRYKEIRTKIQSFPQDSKERIEYLTKELPIDSLNMVRFGVIVLLSEQERQILKDRIESLNNEQQQSVESETTRETTSSTSAVKSANDKTLTQEQKTLVVNEFKSFKSEKEKINFLKSTDVSSAEAIKEAVLSTKAEFVLTVEEYKAIEDKINPPKNNQATTTTRSTTIPTTKNNMSKNNEVKETLQQPSSSEVGSHILRPIEKPINVIKDNIPSLYNRQTAATQSQVQEKNEGSFVSNITKKQRQSNSRNLGKS